MIISARFEKQLPKVQKYAATRRSVRRNNLHCAQITALFLVFFFPNQNMNSIFERTRNSTIKKNVPNNTKLFYSYGLDFEDFEYSRQTLTVISANI